MLFAAAMGFLGSLLCPLFLIKELLFRDGAGQALVASCNEDRLVFQGYEGVMTEQNYEMLRGIAHSSDPKYKDTVEFR